MTIERTSTNAARSTDHDRVDDREEATIDGPRAFREYEGGGAIATREHDAALSVFVQNQRRSPQPNDDILHIGMNRESAAGEVKELSKYAKVTSLKHERINPEELSLFLRARGIDAKQADAIAEVVKNATQGQAELAQLAALWARGEMGQTIPSRVVISGHSSGEDVWDGAGNGAISFSDIKKLGVVMPKAAAQIEDVHISACQSGGQFALAEDRKEWLRAFPNLKTAWSYGGSAPKGGGAHLGDWARATAGRSDTLDLTDRRSKEAVGVWDRKAGYRDGAEPLDRVRAREAEADARFGAWFDGSSVPPNPDDAAITNAYRTYKALGRRVDLPQAEQEACDAKAHQLLCIRFYDASIRGELGQRYNTQLGVAFRAVGLPPPDFKAMSRKQAVAAIDAFERAAANKPGVEGALQLALKIKNLSPDTVHATWCRH